MEKPELLHISPNQVYHEAKHLALDSSKAREKLGWRPRWSTDESLIMTADWHLRVASGDDASSTCADQIAAFEDAVS